MLKVKKYKNTKHNPYIYIDTPKPLYNISLQFLNTLIKLNTHKNYTHIKQTLLNTHIHILKDLESLNSRSFSLGYRTKRLYQIMSRHLGTASYYKVFFLCSIGFWSYALRSLEVKIKLYPMLEKDHR